MPQKKKQSEWLALAGSAEIDHHGIYYTPITIKDGPSAGQTAVAVLRSNNYFQEGIVDFQACLEGPDCKCQLILNHGGESEFFVGLNFGSAAYGIAVFRNSKWEPASATTATSGDPPPPLNTWIKVKVSVLGSNVSLFINDVKVATSQLIIQKSQLGLFLHGSAPVHVRNLIVQSQKPKAFVVMQFTDEFNALYKEVIKPTCENFGYECVRADNIYTNGQIIEDIANNIEEAAVVIADITPNNPNVFYEVGYSHGIKKPTILLSDKTREKLPFDVSGFRTLFYENTIGGKSLIEERLTKHLESIRG
jgi:hypothetical protein